jgi:hypothetical protein
MKYLISTLFFSIISLNSFAMKDFSFEGIQNDGVTRCRLESLNDRFMAKYYVDYGHDELIPFETGFLFKDLLSVKGGLVSIKSSYKIAIEFSEGEAYAYVITLPREGGYRTIHCLKID